MSSDECCRMIERRVKAADETFPTYGVPAAPACKCAQGNTGAAPPISDEGKVIAGRYTVVHGLASGGYGTIFEAHDRVTGTTVAIKIDNKGLFVPNRLLNAQGLPTCEEDASALALELLRHIKQHHHFKVSKMAR
eukprot:364930-Chlamydomonas_euryale.AAC.12